MSMEIVNGYPCFNCTDVANAKKGIDPAHPDNDPLKAKDKSQSSGANGIASSRQDDAVVLGGQLGGIAALNGSQSIASDSASLNTLRMNQPGSLLNLTV